MRDECNQILLNWDGDAEHWFLSNLGEDWSDLETKATDYLDRYYAGRGIRDILFNIFTQSSVTPSGVWTDRCAKYRTKLEGGIAVDYTNESRIALLKKCREDYGVGLTELWIRHCRKIGIRPWISLRMNDCHFHFENTSWIRSDFFYEAMEKGWVIGDAYGYYARCYNYAVPEVRQRMLNYIEEQLTAIDVDGIEFDFMREATSFDYRNCPDCCQIMNDFMCKAKSIIIKCELLHGHKIRIGVRLHRDIHVCKRAGFDAVYWAQNGLVDLVSPCARWNTTDTGMPITQWVKALSPYGVEVCAGLEIKLPNELRVRAEVAKAHTLQYAAQGSARTYIYNIYHPYLSEGSQDRDYPTHVDITDVWEVCSDLDKCRRGIRRHILTFEDSRFPDLKKPWVPLPATLAEDTQLEIQTGPIEETCTMVLYLGLRNTDHSQVQVTFGGAGCEYAGFGIGADILRNTAFQPEDIAAFRVPNRNTAPLKQVFSVTGPEKGEIFYAELLIDGK